MEKKISRFAKGYYALISLLLLVPLVLPIYTIREYNDQAQIVSEEAVRAANISGGFFSGLLVLVVLAILSLAIPLYVTTRRGGPGYFTFISAIVAFLPIFYMDENYRSIVIRDAYSAQEAFGSVASGHIGYFAYFVGFFLILSLKGLNHSHNSKEFFQSKLESLKSFAKSFYGPTTVQYLTFHIFALVVMMVTYSIGMDTSSFWEGPSYYLDLIYTYGLNRGLETPSLLLAFSWVLAPMIVIPVGVVLFLLNSAGFAENGAPLSVVAPEFKFVNNELLEFEHWAFFSKDVPLAESYLGSPKINGFYMYTIFGTFILGMLLGAIVRNYIFGSEKGVKFYSYLKFYVAVSIFFGFTFASMSAPVYIIPGGLLTSLFVDRRFNRFIRYKYLLVDHADNGNYHPVSIMFAVLIFSVPLIIISTGIDYLTKLFLSGKLFEQKESKQIVGRFIDESKSDLPWNK